MSDPQGHEHHDEREHEPDRGYGLEAPASTGAQPAPHGAGAEAARQSAGPQRFIGLPDEQVIEHMRVRQRRGRGAPGLALNMTSMIDIVFLLLIYFLVATDFRLGEEAYRMDIPAREGATEADPFTLDDEPLRIVVTSTGLAPDMYRLRLEGPYPQPATFEDLHTFLTSRQVRPDVTGGLFQPDHPVVVQPGRTARWEHAMQAFNAAARARYTNVTFAKPG